MPNVSSFFVKHMEALQAKHSSCKGSTFYFPFIKKKEIFTLFFFPNTFTRFLSVYTLLSVKGECTLPSCRVELYKPYLCLLLMEMFLECVCYVGAYMNGLEWRCVGFT